MPGSRPGRMVEACRSKMTPAANATLQLRGPNENLALEAALHAQPKPDAPALVALGQSQRGRRWNAVGRPS
eukprot:3357281-Lingulodinium_polyedra.AAC.1